MFVQVTRNNMYLTFGQYSKLSHLDLIVGHKIFHKYLIILQHEHNTLFVLLSIKIFPSLFNTYSIRQIKPMEERKCLFLVSQELTSMHMFSMNALKIRKEFLRPTIMMKFLQPSVKLTLT